MIAAQMNSASRVRVLRGNPVQPTRRGQRQETATEPRLKKRVAAYCRVSTDHEDQETSFEAQQKHFKSLISETPAWELVGIYADEESGTRAAKQDNFMRMIGDCESGKVDMVLSKSISRWARNTLDSLKYIRKLKALEIPVIFTKEGINTMDSSGELLVTIMSSIAQQESASISQNVQIGVRYHYQEGKICSGVHRLLGYERTPDGSLAIVPEEAEIVQRIYRDYLDGYSIKHISEMLQEEGVDGSKTTVTGIEMPRVWSPSGTQYILENEKYAGDLLLQKYYTVDFLSKKVARNTGQLPQYFVENSHDPIIPKEIFLQVQAEMARRRHFWQDFRYSHSNALASKVYCGNCGSPYRKLRDLQGRWAEASEQRAVYADKALQIRNLTEEGQDRYAYLLSPTGKCDNGNITQNGWERTFYAKAKENFIGGNTIETNSVGSTVFTGTHTILQDKSGNLLPDAVKKIVDNTGREKPINKDIPTPHVNVKQLQLTENNTEWKVYVQTKVDPLPQLKALYDNIMVQEVVDSSSEHMITNKSAILFAPGTGTDPETFYLKDVFGDSGNVDWTTLIADREEGEPPAYVDLPYISSNYGHNTGYIRLTLTKDGDTADYNEHNTSNNLNEVEEYVLSAQFIPYTVDEMISSHGEATDSHDHLYHTTPQESASSEQAHGKPSVNTHIIDLFVRGLSISKTNESFEKGLSGAEFTVYRPATEEEIEAGGDAIITFEGDTGKYIFDRELSFDINGVAYVNGVRSLTPPKTTYYIVETKAPDGYELRKDPIPAVLEITNEYYPLPVEDGTQPAAQETRPESGMYNWVEKASLKLVSEYGILRTTGTYDPSNPETVYGHHAEPTSEYEVMYYRISNTPGVELPSTGGPVPR